MDKTSFVVLQFSTFLFHCLLAFPRNYGNVSNCTIRVSNKTQITFNIKNVMLNVSMVVRIFFLDHFHIKDIIISMNKPYMLDHVIWWSQVGTLIDSLNIVFVLTLYVPANNYRSCRDVFLSSF